MSLTTLERRRLPLSDASAEIRVDGGDDGHGERRFHGYATKFNARTAIGNPLTWGFYEEFAAGVYTKTLSEGDQRFLIDHDSYYVVSRVSADTLNLAQDRVGLAVDSALDMRLSYVSDLAVNLENRNVTGMSVGFYPVKVDWVEEDIETSDGQSATVEVRIIREAKLIEVSAVTFPAYEDTEADVRSVSAALLRRGDPGAIERRAAHRPELRDLLQVIEPREPGEPTRADASEEPGESTPRRHVDRIDLAMRGLAARYRLPR
ncbi:HK97 family phage prohead protease [Nocardiopsis gilva YIM 90087]|uniref:HK97 family phage prohead protease n=1 Tax=Nocardiopsis gilva YIM 90087 TaxID=1235441 RepID=A0A223S627_9ACTN|nr:HK97 family phage prohead protease [Nocardiopsis gilva]ASU83575.1 HK97 family phage prohead protease [Nocardiopsis gilva YIM 90087]